MAEAKTKNPTISESISKIEDSIVEAKSNGDTRRLKILEKVLEALLNKKKRERYRS